jgi:polysaccharide export outer membrane protein
LTPEFNQTVTVQPDGYVTLIGAGDIHAEGDTVAEVTEAIRSAYGKILHEPIVSIHLRDFERPYFVVGGEVGHPGKYDLRGDTTVVQAIAISGGFTDSAKHSKVWLFRRVSNDWVETRNLDIKKMLTTGNLSEDLHLRPSDMLYVPKSTSAKIRHYLPATSMGMYFNPIP